MTLSLKLIGYPIEHSMSPWIHNEFIKRSNQAGAYTLFEIHPDELFEEKVSLLKNKSLLGFNVTVPYKQAIIPFLDKLDGIAEVMGAVNTVSVKGGIWTGHNTDGQGYIRSLHAAYPITKNAFHMRILILGAGGAARGIYHALRTQGYTNVTIANRTRSRAEAIVGDKGKDSVITLDEAEENLHQMDIVIQTSAVGMNESRSIISLENLRNDTIVSDIVYQPLETHFLKRAKQETSKIHYGHTMLLYQAQAAFEIWTGQNVDVTGMDKQMERILKGR